MTTDITKKQQLRFFLMIASAFAILFLLLGLIIFHLLQISAYRETDVSLENMSMDYRFIEREMQKLSTEGNANDFRLENIKGEEKNPLPPSFTTQVILWNVDGEMLNQDTMGGRYSQLETLKLNTQQLDSIVSIKLSENDLAFRSLTISNRVFKNTDIAYIQFLTNTNQIDESIQTFHWILIGCMIFFWLISLVVSVFISKMNMRPILIAWGKQQEFVENASHELRTPLTIIQNNLQYVFTKPKETILDQSQRIAQALNETRRLTNLTSDLLLLARSEGNQRTVQPTLTNVNSFLEQLVDPFFEISEMQGKTFKLECMITEEIAFDVEKIHQVLVILLDNALKYTKEAATIEVSAQTVHSKYWQISVRNDGGRISDEDKKLIFERFYREEKSRNQETGGHGLGLSIAQQIIKNHKGKIHAADWGKDGVEFTIQLPIAIS